MPWARCALCVDPVRHRAQPTGPQRCRPEQRDLVHVGTRRPQQLVGVGRCVAVDGVGEEVRVAGERVHLGDEVGPAGGVVALYFILVGDKMESEGPEYEVGLHDTADLYDRFRRHAVPINFPGQFFQHLEDSGGSGIDDWLMGFGLSRTW